MSHDVRLLESEVTTNRRFKLWRKHRPFAMREGIYAGRACLQARRFRENVSQLHQRFLPRAFRCADRDDQTAEVQRGSSAGFIGACGGMTRPARGRLEGDGKKMRLAVLRETHLSNFRYPEHLACTSVVGVVFMNSGCRAESVCRGTSTYAQR